MHSSHSEWCQKKIQADSSKSAEHINTNRLTSFLLAFHCAISCFTVPVSRFHSWHSEACCKHVVQIAKHEVDSNPRASHAMRDFASIREADAEVGARRVLVQHGYSAPIGLSWIDLGEEKQLKKFPWMKLSSWAKHLLDIHALPRQMVGVPTFQKMKGVLAEFWERYRGMDPGHPVFSLERAGVISCDRLIPYYSHSDEGRTFRDGALWVLNTHGVIGRGTLAFLKKNKHWAPVRRNAQGLNYVGNTWSTHCLIATMMKDVASPEALSTLLSAFAADARSLLHEGLGHGDEKVWFCHLAHKGDLPALSKVGRFTRTFGHAPKAASSRKPCRGICWKCLAGPEQDDRNNRVALPYEDVTMQPIWEDTMGTSLPWEVAPTILEGLDLDDQRAIDFFETDFFHNVHLGVLKSFTSSALVCLVEADPPLPLFDGCRSVEAKFERLTGMYQDFFRTRRSKPWVSELSRDTVCWPMSSACPAAKWNKGMATVQIMRFLDWLCQGHLADATDPLMKAIVLGLHMRVKM